MSWHHNREECWRTVCNVAAWKVTHYIILTHYLDWKWVQHEVQAGSNPLKPLLAKCLQDGLNFSKSHWSSGMEGFKSWRYPHFPSLNKFQMGNGCAWTAKTILGCLWKPEYRKSLWTLPSLTLLCKNNRQKCIIKVMSKDMYYNLERCFEIL